METETSGSAGYDDYFSFQGEDVGEVLEFGFVVNGHLGRVG